MVSVVHVLCHLPKLYLIYHLWQIQVENLCTRPLSLTDLQVSTSLVWNLLRSHDSHPKDYHDGGMFKSRMHKLEWVPYVMLDGDSKSPDFGSGCIHGYLSREVCILVPDSRLSTTVLMRSRVLLVLLEHPYICLLELFSVILWEVDFSSIWLINGS